MPKAQSDGSRDAAAAKPASPKASAKTGAAGSAKPAAETAKRPEPTPVATPAAKPADAIPPVTSPAAEAAVENPLHKKLRLRPEDAGAIVAPPRDADNPLLPLPASFLVFQQAEDLASHSGKFAYIHVFARDRADLIESFPLLGNNLAPGGSLWISWLKQSSGRGAGRFGDLNENVIRRLGLTNALVEVKVTALDRDWAALRLVHRKH